MVTNVVAVAHIWQFLLNDSFGLVDRAPEATTGDIALMPRRLPSFVHKRS